MRPRRARWRHRLLLALVTLYSLFPIYFITVQSLKTPQEDVFGNPLWIAAPTFENYTELFEGGEARARGKLLGNIATPVVLKPGAVGFGLSPN